MIRPDAHLAADIMAPTHPLVTAAARTFDETEAEALPPAKRGKFQLKRFFSGKKDSASMENGRADAIEETSAATLPDLAPVEMAADIPDRRHAEVPPAVPTQERVLPTAEAAAPEAGAPERAGVAPPTTGSEPAPAASLAADISPAAPARPAFSGVPPASRRTDLHAATGEPPSTMTSTDPTNPSSGSRASAQLTLGFEVTSLQLTPFFKLGSVQLKALSNVVSLHLIAAQGAESPLAAGISFQIQRVDLDEASHLKSLLLKPLGESREMTVPLPKLQVDDVAVTEKSDGAPISVTTSGQASTAVQLFGTFVIAAMEFTPAFEIGSMRLEPATNTVRVRVAPSARPTALDLPPAFEIAEVQIDDGAQIVGVRVTPTANSAR